ncbi:MAG: guanosine polyphosphate pyrophosphohydrolase [Lysobacterales bacterium RIFOXYA1_FULL_69_10]|nr:MAG: guanosine polyphosphate pyrophosphohydrolase [Xanthomonadales bacterium RIFOXYA1_FULL_69_10]
MTALTERFARAVDYARIAHAGQTRKGTAIPYITHLLGVAALVLEYGGDEDQAIAGLLHDTLEDCGAHHEPIIRQQFGDRVADIVLACTDGTAEDKGTHTDAEAKRRDWLARKQAYLAHLAEAPDDVLLVSACDKLHNARSIVQDIEDPAVCLAVFDRFKSGRDGTLAYYESLARQFNAAAAAPARAIDAIVGRMHAMADGTTRQPLPYATFPALA